MARVLRLPNHGRLIVCTDLQGCMRDYERIVEVFHAALAAHDGDAHLLFTGDLIHGPYLEPDEWPAFLGEFYRDASGEVVDQLMALSARHPGRVHALLGNHEHGHVGGPHTAKFAMDEVILLETLLGEEATRRLHAAIATFALAAVAPCGVVFTHAAPAAQIKSIKDVEQADLSGRGLASPLEVLDTPVVGKILWARSADVASARRFVKAMGATVSVYGHDVVPEGFERIGDEQLCVSTSFGVVDPNKVYLNLDLASRYRTAAELRVGREILPLYPERASKRLR
ncbi:MAG: metallophosphoesterase [Kofleriaceae bacterium]|nr:metallophosphoesterase [Kofleriaceae bacterium]